MQIEDLKKLWSRPIYLPDLQPELNSKYIGETEKNIGYKLPKEFIQLLKIQNGGYIRMKLEDLPHNQIFGIGPYLPNLSKVDWSEESVSFELEGLIPFDGDGHWYLCLDYRSNEKDPEIWYIDLECDSQSKIANNFKDYLTKLSPNYIEDYLILSPLTLEELVIKIGSILRIKFEDPDTNLYGYKHFRGKRRASWIWISPNQVPRGFVREDDARYEELKGQIKGNSLRHPELPSNSILLKFSNEKWALKAVKRLRKHHIDIRPINACI